MSLSLDNCPSCKLWLYRVFPFLRWWPMVNKDSNKADIIAGITGAMIVLPQGVAFATIAGMPPEYGLYAAMVPAIIAALFGSSWHLVSGPTTAISIAVFAAMSPFADPGSPQFVSMVLTLTFLTGVFQLALGLARMGVLVNFISHTVVIGFTAGAALLIAASQVKSFFGIAIERGAHFHVVLEQLIMQFDHLNPYVTTVGAVTLATGILARKFIPKVPYMIVAMVVGSIVAFLINLEFGVELTKIKTVGALPAHLPPLSLPDFSYATIHKVVFPALVVTMLALTEAVSISRAIATKSEQRIDGNQEFVGQGLANLIGSFFSGYASAGSFNRSGVNYASGAQTPLATVYAAIFLVLILLLVAPLASYLPNAAMAGILFLVAWSLIDFHHIRSIGKTSKAETVVLWVTLIGTLVDLEKGIFFGILLSLTLYLYRVSRPSLIPEVPAKEEGAYHLMDAHGHHECPQFRIVRINGSIFFGAVDYVQNGLTQIDEANPDQKSVMIIASGINFIDVAGAEMLAQEARRRRKLGGGLYFYRCKDSIYKFLRKSDKLDDIGAGAFFPAMSNWIKPIYSTLNPEICRNCKYRIFPECQTYLPDGEPRTTDA
ncbi:high affinity sulfate transporter SulP [Sulfuricella denitrificans skB26]|uniref:High affinity sulfate transporter SulP n=1 Tax=Sulfuricella denitrificans (strain DSM 22764 / NBRC 105220 / skB26) TaxID=1163617 RepID=S6ACS8_SULDS|nr:SulP family inorganic anion transporter [Sulfuricella denitrificans]BAN35828.1 high affinity sulfate transporter SulP [Sulfuricella denitrificans skB26]